MDTATYEGSCHCGAVRFRITGEPITAGLCCNCSICTRRGLVMSVPYYPPGSFTLLAGADALSVYRWGDRMVNNSFCRICGVAVFHDTTVRPGHYRVNLGCVAGVETRALPLTWVDGRSF